MRTSIAKAMCSFVVRAPATHANTRRRPGIPGFGGALVTVVDDLGAGVAEEEGLHGCDDTPASATYHRRRPHRISLPSPIHRTPRQRPPPQKPHQRQTKTNRTQTRPPPTWRPG